MDFILEFLFEIILEGTIAITEERKVPFILRFICGVIIGVFYAGLIGVLLTVAISNKSPLMIFVTILIAVLVLYAFIHKYKEFKKNKTDE